MAAKITASALYPGNNKQKVALALAIFHKTTIAAFKIYKPARKDVVSFLSSWWAMINSKQRYNPNALGNAIISGDGKIDFFSFAKWLENWRFSAGSTFCLSKQISSALIYTLCSQSQLINDLLEEGYSYVRVRRMQSDPIERRFLKYRKMNGDHFLVSLNEVTNSEKILLCRSLLKEDIDFWNESALVTNPSLNFEKLEQLLKENFVATEETTPTNKSEEVSLLHCRLRCKTTPY